MTETERSIIGRIIKQFGNNINTGVMITPEMSDAEIFRTLTTGRSNGKNYCSRIFGGNGHRENTLKRS
jgi:hypothetical protein